MIENSVSYLSACGIFDCATCAYQERNQCMGCSQSNTMMAANAELRCAIFECTRYHKLISCADCSEAVCPFTKSSEMICPARSRFEKKRSYGSKISSHFSSRHEISQNVSLVSKKLDKAISRLPWYLFAIQEFINNGVIRVSSEDISRKIGVKSWLVRRDLSQFGEFGRPGIGYETGLLKKRLSEILHLDVPKSIIWIGAARLEVDKSLIKRLAGHNYDVVAIFDKDLSRTPEMIGGLNVFGMNRLSQKVTELGVEGAIIATPSEDAQHIADILVACGIKGILNLTSTIVAVPTDVCARNVDIVAELFALTYFCAEAHADANEGKTDAPKN